MKDVLLQTFLSRQRQSGAGLLGWLVLIFVFAAGTANAQQNTVSGRVTDETGNGMPGVNVLVEGTTTGTTTDSNGDYALDVADPQATLVFSFIGYETEHVPLNGRTRVDLTMAPGIHSLDEVVVVGYGTQRRSDVTGSLVSVSTEALQEVPVANLQQALQGRAAGLEVQRMGTAPGASARIRIRGERSILGSNDPLIVLDGIPYEGSISDINQNDIATVNILKDASATAIYGSRGANGVILITTKRGQPGETRLTLDSYYGVTTVARKYDMMNSEEYAAYRDASGWPYGYMPEEVEGLALGRNTDWQELMYEEGFITDHNLTVSGGSEYTTFAIGGGYFKETTVLPGQDFERYSIKATVDTRVGERLRIGVNSLNSVSFASGTQFVNQQANTPGAFGGSMMFNMLSLSPLMPAYNANGEIFRTPAGNNDDKNAYYSPLYLKQNNNAWADEVRRLRTFNSLFAEYEILDELKYRLNVGLDYNQQNYAQFRGSDTYFRPGQGNQARVRNAEQYSWTAENILTYDKTFNNKHRLTFTGLFSAQQSRSWYTQVHKDSVTADFIQYYHMGLSSATAQTVLDGGEQTWGILSYMGRINYAFDDRYLLTLTYRRDGSSRLAEKWHQYPAIAFGWNIINEDFMPSTNTLSNLKLRVGYGQTSNQAVNPYTTLGGVGNLFYSGNSSYPIKYNYGSVRVSGFIPGRIPDKTLDWEYTNTLNVGVEFGLFNDRITGTADWYHAETSNLLYNVTLPVTSGYQEAFQTNVGGMENKGLEIALSTINVQSPTGFSWNTDINWFYNRNKILELHEGVERDIGNGLFVGHSLSAIYDYQKIGIWQLDEAAEAAAFGQQPGQLKLADISGPEGVPDGEITEEHDRTIIGDQQAKWQGGITNRFAYKGFDLSVVAYFRYGGTLLSYLHAPNGAYLTQLSGSRNQLNVDYWTPDNPTNDFPQPSSSLPGGASTAWTTLAYYDASFAKIRSINVGYTLPPAVIDRIKAQNIRVYFTAQNPFLLFSPYVNNHKGLDPEPTGQGQTGIIAAAESFRGGGQNPQLVISASTPPTRSFIFGVNISF